MMFLGPWEGNGIDDWLIYQLATVSYSEHLPLQMEDSLTKAENSIYGFRKQFYSMSTLKDSSLPPESYDIPSFGLLIRFYSSRNEFADLHNNYITTAPTGDKDSLFHLHLSIIDGRSGWGEVELQSSFGLYFPAVWGSRTL